MSAMKRIQEELKERLRESGQRKILVSYVHDPDTWEMLGCVVGFVEELSILDGNTLESENTSPADRTIFVGRIGWSLYNPHDQWSKSRARLIAFGRGLCYSPAQAVNEVDYSWRRIPREKKEPLLVAMFKMAGRINRYFQRDLIDEESLAEVVTSMPMIAGIFTNYSPFFRPYV